MVMKHIESGAWKIVGGALIFSFGFAALKSCADRMPPAGPDTSHAQFAAAETAAARPHAASTAAVAKLAPSSAATVAPRELVVTWPSLIPPAGLMPGRVDYALVASPWVNFGVWGPDVAIGGATVAASTSSFSALPVAGLADDVPTRGRVRETWTWWMHVPIGGAQTLVLREHAVAGETAAATLAVDTDSTPSVSVACCAAAIAGGSPQQVGIGQVDLASGWHKLTLKVLHVPEAGPVSIDVFKRGPSDASPTTITPFAPASATPAPPAPSASAASAPAVIPIGGEGHPVPAIAEKKS